MVFLARILPSPTMHKAVIRPQTLMEPSEELISIALKQIDDADENNNLFNTDKFNNILEKVQREWRITVFLSSPFDGCEQERELFMQQFVPSLSSLCMERGVLLSVVDMRWGITQATEKADGTLLACLSALDKSDVFIGYFGARYGSSTLVAKNQGWINKAIDVCIRQNPSIFGFLDNCRDISITAMEWQQAFLHGSNAEDAGKPLCFFLYRSPEYDARMESEAQSRDDAFRANCYRIENTESAEAALRLRGAVRSKCVSSDTAAGCKGFLLEDYADPRVAAAVMNHICTKLFTRILQSLDIRCSSACLAHMVFARKKLGVFKDFGDYVGMVLLFIRRNYKGFSPILVLCGQSGSGKSSLMAAIVQNFWNDEALKFASREYFIIYYFVGCNAVSTTLCSLLHLVYDEFARYLSEIYPDAKDRLKPFDNYDLNDILPEIINCFNTLGRKPCRLIIVIDALNQLIDEPYNTRNDVPSMLAWLPMQFPPMMRVVVSCINDTTRGVYNSASVIHYHLQERLANKDVEWLEVEPFDEDQRRDVVEMWHSLYSKTVDEPVMAPVWECEMCANPVFLSLVMKCLVLYGSWATLMRTEGNIRDKLLSAQSLSELIMIMIEHVEIRASTETGRVGTVKNILMYIFCSREGLTMDELKDLLVQDWKLLDRESSPSIAVGPGFWLTLITYSMEHLLDCRQGLYNFSHDSVRQAVERAYFGNGKLIDELRDEGEALVSAHKIKTNKHHRLALYFKVRSDSDESPMTRDSRVRREAVFQEVRGGNRPSVIVATRVRPMNAREKAAAANRPVVTMKGKKTMVLNPKSLKDDIFTLDFALDSGDAEAKTHISQDRVYQLCGEDVVGQVIDGVNVSVFAYGQTGSGKSYTMFGTEESPGLIPRILTNLFTRLDVRRKQMVWSWAMQCTMVEVYMGKYRDLLNDGAIVTVILEDDPSGAVHDTGTDT